MVEKSIVQEAKDIQLAMELISLGARLQMLESETQLSRGRLIKLYKELRGSPPPKGMLPFSNRLVYNLGTEHPFFDVLQRLSISGKKRAVQRRGGGDQSLSPLLGAVSSAARRSAVAGADPRLDIGALRR